MVPCPYDHSGQALAGKSSVHGLGGTGSGSVTRGFRGGGAGQVTWLMVGESGQVTHGKGLGSGGSWSGGRSGSA